MDKLNIPQMVSKQSIETALYNTFAFELGPDAWETAENQFWLELEVVLYARTIAAVAPSRPRLSKTGLRS